MRIPVAYHAGNLVVAIALTLHAALGFATCSSPEAFWNVFLPLGTLGVAAWLLRGWCRRPMRAPQRLSLVFVLALLFPLISSSDGLAQRRLISDTSTAQSVVSEASSERQPVSLGTAALLTATAARLCALTFIPQDRISSIALAAAKVCSLHASRIHSPPPRPCEPSARLWQRSGA